MSESFFLASSGYAYCLLKGDRTQLSPALSGFDMLSTPGTEGECGKSVVLVRQVSIVRQGISVPVVGVDKTQVLYLFGENFGKVTIQAVVLTGGKEYDGKQPKGIIEAWEQEGIVGSKNPLNLKWAGVEVKVYITDITAVSADAQYGTIQVTMNALIAPVSNKES
jgi:hypothetical protein